MEILVGIHGLVRWLVVLVAVIAVVRYALVMAGKAQSSGMDRGLMSGYTGLLDLNVLLGVIIIIGLGEWEVVQIEHAVTNIIAVVVAHIFAQRAKKIEDPKLKARTSLLGVVISILIIVVGVAFVGGWAR
jgi:heme A synthase